MSVTSINNSDFEEKILKSSLPFIVDFWGEGCGPCKMFLPIFEKTSDNYTGRINFYKVNVRDNLDLAQEYNIRMIPCTVLFKNGKEVDRFLGLLSEKDLTKRLEQII